MDGEKCSNLHKPKVTPEVGRKGWWVLEPNSRARQRGRETPSTKKKTKQNQLFGMFCFRHHTLASPWKRPGCYQCPGELKERKHKLVFLI